MICLSFFRLPLPFPPHNNIAPTTAKRTTAFHCRLTHHPPPLPLSTNEHSLSSCQLLETLTTMKQAPGQSISDFLVLMHSIWDQLALVEPQWVRPEDAEKFMAYRDKMRVMQFLMALKNLCVDIFFTEKYFPPLEIVVAELLSEETRLRILKTEEQVPTNVMAVASSGTTEKTCRYCKCPGHVISECHKLYAKQHNYRNNGRPSKPSLQTSAAVIDKATPSISLSALQAFLDQVNTNNSTSASATPGYQKGKGIMTPWL